MTQRPTYDLQQRERIRRALQQYKVRHGIGAPQIAKRIAEANPNAFMVDQRRISRFLSKKHQPEDMFIAWCDRFLQSVPPVPDPNTELARGLKEFYQVVPDPPYQGRYFMHLRDEGSEDDFSLNSQLIMRNEDFYLSVEQRSLEGRIMRSGVLVETPQECIALLRGTLTGYASTYHLTPDSTGFDGGLLHRSTEIDGVLPCIVRLDRADATGHDDSPATD